MRNAGMIYLRDNASIFTHATSKSVVFLQDADCNFSLAGKMYRMTRMVHKWQIRVIPRTVHVSLCVGFESTENFFDELPWRDLQRCGRTRFSP